MTRTPKPWIVLSILVVLICLVALPVLAAQSPGIEWYVISSGGGSTTNGDTTLNNTIGQPVAGLSSSDPGLCSGFWCGGSEQFINTPTPTLTATPTATATLPIPVTGGNSLFLPLALRESNN